MRTRSSRTKVAEGAEKSILEESEAGSTTRSCLQDVIGPLYSSPSSSDCLYKTSTKSSQSTWGDEDGGTMSPHPWEAMDSRWLLEKGESILLKGMGSGKSTTLQWVSPHLGRTQAARTGLNRLLSRKSRTKLKEARGRGGSGKSWRRKGVDTIKTQFMK